MQVLFTVVVVLSEKVETTVQKGIFRAAGTVFGGAIGYAAMLRTQSATSPVLLVAVLCVWVFLGSWLALKTEVGPASESLAPGLLFPLAAVMSATVKLHVWWLCATYMRSNSNLSRQSRSAK